MSKHSKLRSEFLEAIQALHQQEPYFVEERLTRHRGRFLRAVKDVDPGQTWWELRYFYTYEGPCWAYLPENRQGGEFGWGYTMQQAYLNAILQQSG